MRRSTTTTEVLAVDPAAPDVPALTRAVALLRDGGVVAIPTETFYGLAAHALNADAVRRIFELKGRPAAKPVLVLVDGVAMAETLVTIPAAARALVARHWPGPLTLVLPARSVVPAALSAGTGTLGVRVSSHAVATALVRRLGAPVTAPSANPEGEEPPTTAGAVLRYFEGSIDLVLDAGPTAGGTASTVLDATVDPPRVLRAGPLRP